MNRKYSNCIIAGMAAIMFALSGVAIGAGQSQSGYKVINMFGGPAYLGAPNLALTAAFIRAGGGVQHFSTAEALTSMLGQQTVKAEVAKLTKQYGQESVKNWLQGTAGVVALALKHASQKGIALPQAPANLKGHALAVALVKAGTAPNGTFWAGRLYDTLVSHAIHNAVMKDVNQTPKLGITYDRNVHKITNQAFYDVAHALGMEQVKLADLH